MKKTIKELQDAVKVAQLALLEAETIELEISRAALLSASFLNEETGERIVDPAQDYMMSDDDFFEYLEIRRQQFLSRGIDCPDAEFIYSYFFKLELESVEDALLDACAKVMPSIGKMAIEKARKHLKFRQKLIDISLKLDPSTIPSNYPA